MTISKRSSLIALTVLLAALGTTSAQAGDTGWYVGANVGVSNYSALIADSENGLPGIPFDNSNSATGWSALGGYQLISWLGLEFSYFDMGNASSRIPGLVGTVNYKLHGESLDVVLSSSLQGWGIFGKVGLTAANVEETLTYNPDTTARSTILDFGAGISYGMQNGWGLRLGFTQYHNADDKNRYTNSVAGRANVNFIYLGAVRHF